MSNVIPFPRRAIARDQRVAALFALVLSHARRATHNPKCSPEYRDACRALLRGHALRTQGERAC